jgi:hypothetical protein
MSLPSPAFLLVIVLAVALTGCSTGVRPDAEVAEMVAREDRRLEEARRQELALRAAGALAWAGGALAELTSVEVAAGGLLWGPLYVPQREADRGSPGGAAVEQRVLPPEPPPGWPRFDALYAAWALEEAQSGESYSDDEFPATDGPPGDRRERKSGNSRPKLRVDLLRFRLRGNPVSFSGSLRGVKGLQIKATIKM